MTIASRQCLSGFQPLHIRTLQDDLMIFEMNNHLCVKLSVMIFCSDNIVEFCYLRIYKVLSIALSLVNLNVHLQLHYFVS